MQTDQNDKWNEKKKILKNHKILQIRTDKNKKIPK